LDSRTQNAVEGITAYDHWAHACAPKLGHRFHLFAQQSLSFALLYADQVVGLIIIHDVQNMEMSAGWLC
jgi:hypothetical protein